MKLRHVVFMGVMLAMAAFAQNPISADSPFQVKYAANLNVGDSVFNISNSGANGGNLCANVYTFSPDEQLISCCTCNVTPNALVSLSARADLISNTLTPAVPNSIVVKIVGSASATCNASVVANQATGILAWGTTLHAKVVPNDGPPLTVYDLTETPFVPATLSTSELARITSLCGFIQSNGSGFGICRSCRLGGQGASKQ